MKLQMPILIVCGLSLAVGTWYFLTRPQSPKVHYPTYTGETATPVTIEFSEPQKELNSVPEARFPTEFNPGELLSLEGNLKLPADGAKPLLFEFVKDANGHEVTEQSGIEIPQGDFSHYKFRINLPKKPGVYRLKVSWLGPEYVARGSVTVRAAPPK